MNNKDEYYGPCKITTMNPERVERQPHNPKQVLINQGVKPEPNYILLGEVEKELKALKERTKKEQIQQKTPQQLNVSNLLEELVSSKKWQVLTSSDQIYEGNKKRPAPQAPTQQQHCHQQQQQIGEFNRRSLPGIPTSHDKVNAPSFIPEILQQSIQTFDEEYLNASEVHKMWQSENKVTYDSIGKIPSSTHANPVIPSNHSHLLHSSNASPSNNKEVTSFNDSKQNQSSDNFFLQRKSADSSQAEIKRDENPNGTVKLLPSDIRKHRIWMSLNPGIKANQETTLDCYDEVDQTQNNISKPHSPWGGFTKHPFPKGANEMGYKRFSNENWNLENEGWHEKLLIKSNKVCGAEFQISAPWLTTTVIISICIGFICGFLTAWFSKTQN